MKPQPPKDLWAQMDSISGAPPEEMIGISAQEFADRHKLSSSRARERLNALVKAGKLIRGKRKWRSGWMSVYRPKE